MRVTTLLLLAVPLTTAALLPAELSTQPICDGPGTGFGPGYVAVEASCTTPGIAQPESPDPEAGQLPESALSPLCLAFAEMGRECIEVVDNRPGAAEVGLPISLADLAQFRPVVGELVVEPDGWGVVGTPTNFYATAETHTMDGELFDAPIEVRWTPTSYVFDYGDGRTETSDASGTAWSGTDESWTETETSHTYAARDDVTASLTVVFTAEVDAGGGWFSVPGTLPVDAPPVSVKIFEVETVLTNGDCMANPSAPGCE